MSKTEENLIDLCLVCNEFMDGFKRSVEEALSFSNRSILEILGKLMLFWKISIEIFMKISLKIVILMQSKGYLARNVDKIL